MTWTPTVIAPVLLVIGLCTCSSPMINEDQFIPHDSAEREAKARMQHWAGVAETLLHNPSIPEDRRIAIRNAISGMRDALTDYNRTRARGTTRAAVIAPIEISAAGIIADNATGIGLGDDILLIPAAPEPECRFR